MNARKLTVLRGKDSSRNGWRNKDRMSSLFLNGQWLREWGFQPRDKVVLERAGDGRIELRRLVAPVADAQFDAAMAGLRRVEVGTLAAAAGFGEMRRAAV